MYLCMYGSVLYIYLCVCVCVCVLAPGNTKGGSITVLLTSFDWIGISCITTYNFCFYLQNRPIQTSQTGGQQYSDTSPFSIPCSHRCVCVCVCVCARACVCNKVAIKVIHLKILSFSVHLSWVKVANNPRQSLSFILTFLFHFFLIFSKNFEQKNDVVSLFASSTGK